MGQSNGLVGRIEGADDDDQPGRFGPNTAEVEAFIAAAGKLKPSQWKRVLAIRRLVASVTNEGAGQEKESAGSIQAAIRSGDGRLSEPMARAGEALFDVLANRSGEKQVAAWQALSALVTRHHLPALKFGAHYAPFSKLIPASGSDALDPMTARFLAALEGLSATQCESLAHRLHIEPAASRALLQAVARHKEVKSEEAVAMAALTVIPAHLTGDSGWAAIRTAVHGGRVLGCMPDLSQQEVAELWAPLEAAIPFASLTEEDARPAAERVTKSKSRVKTAAAKLEGPYGRNSVEVTSFIKSVTELTPIQWMRVLDRRKLVESVARDSSVEPAGVVRSILATIEGTQALDTFTRCRAFAAVERAGFAVDSHSRMRTDQVREMYAPFAETIPLDRVNGSGFAHQLASLSKDDWEKVAAAAPPANEEAVAPLVNAGAALIEFFGGRSDDEAVAAWHAVSALVRRHHLTPIKFAASYAPFASAIPVTNPRSLGAMVSRYVTALGRLGASQCTVLARQWEVDEGASSALSKANVDGSARPAEEAAALAAVVTVPMRLAGSVGWAAVKTAAYGGRVIASRTRLTPDQLEALWTPIQPAIALASLGAPAKKRR